RLTRAVTVAIDRTKIADANGHGLPLVSRLRIATFFALACGVVFLPVDGSGVVARDTSFWLLVLYAWHAVLTTFVLLASFPARWAGARRGSCRCRRRSAGASRASCMASSGSRWPPSMPSSG